MLRISQGRTFTKQIFQIGASPILICASREYLELHGEPNHPQDLSRHACIHLNKLRWGNVWHFERGEEQLRIPVVPQFQANESKSLLAAAVAGAGIVLLPKFVAGSALRAGELVQVLTDWHVATIPVHAVYSANRHITTKVKALVQLLVDRLRGHPDLCAVA
jgi:DNA-binding transcriptional LysR family regulator